MLIYDYKCKGCGQEFYYRTEVPYNGESLQCPECGSKEYELSKEPITMEYPDWNTCSPLSFG